MRRSPLPFVTFGAVMIGVVVASGSCTGKQHLPPPPPAGAGGVGGAGGSTGGTGGQAGTSGGGGVGAGANNPCECLVASAATPGGNCATCINGANQAACLPAIQDCQADPGCLAIISCTSPCGQDGACIAGCVLPFESDPSHLLFFALADCSCNACAPVCHPKEPVTCPDPPPPTGGSGGVGGSGGAGGSAGAGGSGGASGGTGGTGG
jgi:hypothetical protein